MKEKVKFAIALCLACWASCMAHAQKIPGAKPLSLSDSTQVTCLASSACPNCYHYMPTNFTVAKNQAGQPEISLLKISETENDPVTGGILHVLLVWGLDARQEAEAQQRIRAEYDSLAVLVGAVSVDNPADAQTLTIAGDDALAKVLRAGVKGKSEAAVSPGSKMALSFRFDEAQIATVLEFVEQKKNTDAVFKIYLNCRVPYQDGPGSYPVPVRLNLHFSKLYTLFP